MTSWTAARQVPLPSTISWSLLKFMSIELVMPSNHLILCCPLLFLPSVFSSIRAFSNELALCIRSPKFWSFIFSISPSKEYSGVDFQTPGGEKNQMFKINHIVCPNCLDTISHTNTKKFLCQDKKLCKFWQLDGGVNDDLLQDGLCHTQVCCAQSPCPCSRPLLTLTSTLKHSKAGLVQSLRGLLMCTRLCLSPPSVSGRYGV